MHGDDIEKYLERYRERLRQYGYSPETLGWGKHGRQPIRFSVMLDYIGREPDCSVLDIGCGFADLYAFLRSHGWRGRYEGIDLVPDLIEVARARHEGIVLHAGDFAARRYEPDSFDYVVASGIFNAALVHGNEDHILSTLEQMFRVARRMVLADFLTTHVDFQQEGAWHTDPVWLLGQAYRLTRRLVLRNDYMPYEFMLGLYKEQAKTGENVFSGYRPAEGREDS